MTSRTVQRSFRLTTETSALLDDMAKESGESRTSLVEQVLAEGLRTHRHPLISFRTGGSGRREPGLVGTRILVRQIISMLRADSDDVEGVASYLDISETSVRAALSYYADFADEVDRDAAWALDREERELARWQREQDVLA